MPTGKQTILIVVAIKLICLAGFGAYNKWWRYISLPDIMALVRAIGMATIVLLIVLSIVKFPRGVIIHPQSSAGQRAQLAAPDCDPPVQGCVRQIKKDAIAASLTPRKARQRAPSKRALVLDLVFTLILLGGARVLARSLLERPRRGSFVAQGKKVLIVGAGDAGNLILREMLSNRLAGYDADRADRRRPQQAALSLSGREGARHDGRSAGDPRAPTRRGAHRAALGRGAKRASRGLRPAGRPASRSRRCRT